MGDNPAPAAGPSAPYRPPDPVADLPRAMPFDLFWEPQGVYRRYRGHTTIAERRRSFDQICADPRFDDLRYTLTDFREVTDYEFEPSGSAEVAALHIAPLNTNPRIVMAAITTDPRIIALVESFVALGFVRQPYRAFPTEAAARAWIASTGRGAALDVPPRS